jgi:hypothetical protein
MKAKLYTSFQYSYVTLITERQSMEDQIGGAWVEEKIYEFIDIEKA